MQQPMCGYAISAGLRHTTTSGSSSSQAQLQCAWNGVAPVSGAMPSSLSSNPPHALSHPFSLHQLPASAKLSLDLFHLARIPASRKKNIIPQTLSEATQKALPSFPQDLGPRNQPPCSTGPPTVAPGNTELIHRVHVFCEPSNQQRTPAGRRKKINPPFSFQRKQIQALPHHLSEITHSKTRPKSP